MIKQSQERVRLALVFSSLQDVSHSPSSSPMPPNPNVLPPAVQQELSKLLLRHDPSARRLLEFVPHVKVFRYNTTDLNWETTPLIEGTLFAYARESSEAIIVINQANRWIQPIDRNLSIQVEQLRLFCQTNFHGQAQVFCLQFVQTHEPIRIQTFVRRSLEVVASPSPILATDPSISLKQMLKIAEPDPVPLLPPSAFVQASPPGFPAFDPRQHLRQTLLHLVEHDDQFFDTIYQTFLFRRPLPR